MKFNLSEINELFRTRRTIYPEDYSERKVHKEQIEYILNNAQQAPTHGNTQPWRFHVFMNEGKQSLSDVLGKAYLENTPREAQNDQKLAKLIRRPLISPVVIVVSMKRQLEQKIPEIEELQAVACAIQNIHLSCTAYGLGGFWSTPKLIYKNCLNEFLGLNSQDKVVGLFYIGYPKSAWPDQKHRKPLEYNTTWIEK